MKKLILQILFIFVAFAANAQLAGFTVVSPNPIPLPLTPGVAINFVFKYEYFPNLATGLDPSSIVVSFPTGTATAVIGPAAGQFVSIVITPLTGPLTIRVVGSGIASPTASVAVYGSAAFPLPISLTRFDALAKTNSVDLAWSTASEINNATFAVERSFDGKNFSEIAELQGAGDSNDAVNYTLEDKTVYAMAASNMVYYRLKQTDRDGKSSYASTVTVQLNKKGTAAVTSVVADNVYFETATEGDVTVSIMDLSGRVVASKIVAATAGYNQVEMDMANAACGMYIVVLNNGEKITTKKIVR